VTAGEDALAQAISGRSTSAPVVMFDARISQCVAVYNAKTLKWSVASMRIRPLNSPDNADMDCSWSAAFEAEVQAAGGSLEGEMAEVHVIGNRPRVAYTVRG
jgi:hypothetical protein